MVSRGVKLYEARKRLRKDYDKGKISAREYRQQKAVLDKALEQENIKGLEKLATAPQEKVIGTSQQAAIRTLQQKRIITQQQDINQIQEQGTGKTYKGKVVEIDGEKRFIGVRTVSKREQQLRASERQGFYSIYPLTKEKPKAEILAEQTAIRGSLGIYSPYSLTSDVKFNFEKVETQAPKELTQAEKDRRAFSIFIGGIKRAGDFYLTPFKAIYKTTALTQKEFTGKSQTGYSLFGKTEIPKWVSKIYDTGYKQFPSSDLGKVAILSTPVIFQGKNVLTTFAGTGLGKVSFNVAGKGLALYTGYRFIKNPSEETWGDVVTFATFPSYAKYGENVATIYGKGVLNIQAGTSAYFNKYGTTILLAPTGLNVVGGRSAKLRAGRISKAQQRQQSYGVYKNQKTFIDRQTGEVGIRIRNQELKTEQFTKERVIRVDPFSKEVTQIKDVQYNKRGSLITNLRNDFSFKGRGSQPKFNKLYPKGFGSQRISAGKQELIGITMISRGGFSYTQNTPKSFIPVKSLPKNLPKIISIKGSQEVTTLGRTQSVRFPKTPYVEPPQERGFRFGMKENLFRNIKIQQNLREGNLFISDLSKSVELLPPIEKPLKFDITTTPTKTIDVDTVNKAFSVVSLIKFPKSDNIIRNDIKITSSIKQNIAQNQAFTQKQAFDIKTEQLQQQSLKFDFAYKPINIPKTRIKTQTERKETFNIIPTPIKPIQNITTIRQTFKSSKPKQPTYPTLVGFTPKRQKQPKNSLFKGFNIRQPKAYFPSLRASLLGLKGKRDDDLTGLEERFL